MRVATGLGTIGFLSLDFFLTFALASVAFYTIGYVFFTIEYWEPIYGSTHDFWVTLFYQVPPVLSYARNHENPFSGFRPLWFYPAFVTSVWIWLYAGSGFLLKAARRFDLGFDWFNGKFDIEKKPLQSIGLVAGVLVAMVYWAAAIVSRVVG